MNSYEWNKIAGWTLGAVAVVLALSIGTGYLFPQNPPEKPGYVVEGVEEGNAAASADDATAEKPIAFYLASADEAKGAAVFKKCAACHTIDKGAANGMGPNLYGILGLHHAHRSDFSYSDAMAATSDQIWSWDTISKWVENPKAFIPGNKMSFAGLKKPEDRADLLVFLNAHSDNPQPLPAVPADGAAPTDEAAAADTATDASADAGAAGDNAADAGDSSDATEG